METDAGCQCQQTRISGHIDLRQPGSRLAEPEISQDTDQHQKIAHFSVLILHVRVRQEAPMPDNRKIGNRLATSSEMSKRSVGGTNALIRCGCTVA